MSEVILIVDDEPMNAVLLERALEDLEDEGYEFLYAQDGDTALQMIRSEPPALVLLDVQMPGKDGFEVCRIIKGDPDLSATRVAMLTSRGLSSDRREGDQVGADLYVTKPFDPERLAEQIGRLLQIEP